MIVSRQLSYFIQVDANYNTASNYPLVATSFEARFADVWAYLEKMDDVPVIRNVQLQLTGNSFSPSSGAHDLEMRWTASPTGNWESQIPVPSLFPIDANIVNFELRDTQYFGAKADYIFLYRKEMNVNLIWHPSPVLYPTARDGNSWLFKMTFTMRLNLPG